ncbi:MAG: septum site-determining protein MinD [Carnobacterium sp.]|uniref:Septum site-determining protein MinD n=1 Tax=Carnobacterium viridans TaxID=174587 RepID=A0A1H0XNV1_9LACT|nr:septum site-determining protein MinD [Carnobacterium viridans]UDE95656.1 septum site-determining protein MinD [Carnobacterium viridans]SDQ04582.1 septum site-determining protein MinD [Carnobacterium viridans]
MGIAIVITSGKGGVGKTTSTANLGTALALQGKRVCLIDMDIGLRNLDVILGLENRIIYDIVDVVEGRTKLHQAIIKDKRFNDNLYLLPAAQNADKNDVNGEQMIEIVSELKKEYDYILIDCPAGIEQGFQNSIAAADQAILVTTPEISAIRDADRIIGLLEQTELEPPRLIINRIRKRMMQDGEVMDIDEITRHLSIDLLGIVFDDDDVVRSSNKGDPIVLNPKNPASQGYRNIARRILGETVPLMTLTKEKPTLWQKLFGKRK